VSIGTNFRMKHLMKVLESAVTLFLLANVGIFNGKTQVIQLFLMGSNAPLYLALYITTFRNITSTFGP